jgi:hypothetical protein
MPDKPETAEEYLKEYKAYGFQYPGGYELVPFVPYEVARKYGKLVLQECIKEMEERIIDRTCLPHSPPDYFNIAIGNCISILTKRIEENK